MTLTYLLLLIVPALFIIVFIPLSAWRGRPTQFTRLNWLGMAVGSIVFTIILIVAALQVSQLLSEAAYKVTVDYQEIGIDESNGQMWGKKDGDWVKIPKEDAERSVADYHGQNKKRDLALRRADLWPRIVFFIGGTFAALGIGSLLAIFFYRGSTKITASN